MLPLFAQEAPQAGYRELIDSLARTPLSQVVIFVLICTIVRAALFPYLSKTAPHLRTGIYTVARIVNESLDAIIYAGVFVFMLIRPFAVQAFLIPSASMFPTLFENDFIVANKAVYRYSDPQRGDIVVFRPPAFATTADQRGSDGEPKVDFIKRCIGVPGDLIEIHDGNLFMGGVQQADKNKRFTGGVNHPTVSDVTTSGMMQDFKVVLYNGPTYKDWGGKYIPVVTSFHDGHTPNFGPETVISTEYAVGDDEPNTSCFPKWNHGTLTPQEQAVADYLKSAPAQKLPKGYYLMMGDNRDGSFDGRAWGLVPRDAIIGRSEAIWLPFTRWRITR